MGDVVEVIVIGGGVMGCAAALALANAGVETVVLERSVPGAEASSAAAGILGPQSEAHEPGPFFELARKSLELYPALCKELADRTGIDVGFRRSGALHVALLPREREILFEQTRWQSASGLSVEHLDGEAVRAKEPRVTTNAAGGVYLPLEARIDPPMLLKALHIAALRRGARFRSGAYVKAVLLEGGEARGVLLEDGTRLGSKFVVLAAGSWSTLIGGAPLREGQIKPARGQIVELEMRDPLLDSVVFGPGCYLVPRDDGRVLVGSTMEFVGYVREVTARAVRDLLVAAIDLVPGLANASVGRTWSNFRPYSETGAPLIGPTDTPGLILATGHFRNGILLAPITAEIVRAAVTGERGPIDLAPFAVARPAS